MDDDAEIVAEFLVESHENLDQFERDILVERNATDPNRLDIQLSHDLVNQARLFGAKLSFIL